MAATHVLLCNASMGAEGSVTLQLREAAVKQSTHDGQDDGAGHSHGVSGSSSSNSLTSALSNNRNISNISNNNGNSGISNVVKFGGFSSDPGDILADMLGSMQAAGTNIVLQDVDSDELTTFSILECGEGGVFTRFDVSPFEAAISGHSLVTTDGGNVEAGATVTTTTARLATTSGAAERPMDAYNHGSHVGSSSHGNLGGSSGGTVNTLLGHLPHNIIISGGGSGSSNSNSSIASIASNSSSNSNSSLSSTCSNVSSITAITSSSGSGSSRTTLMGSDGGGGGGSSGLGGGGGGSGSNNGGTNSHASLIGSGGGVGAVSTTTGVLMKKSRPKTASPTRNGPQQCMTCNKTFGNASALAKHKLTHSDERKYVCGMCTKAFKRQDHLNGHMLTHRNKKPFECKTTGCGKSYCDARSLRRHNENHHTLGPDGLPILGPDGESGDSAAAAAVAAPATMSTATLTATPTGSPNRSPAAANGDTSSQSDAIIIRTVSANHSYTQTADATTSFAQSSQAIPSSLFNRTTTTITATTNKMLSPTVAVASTVEPRANSPGTGNESLSRQQFDLISQIMQHSKQATLTGGSTSNAQKMPLQPPTTTQPLSPANQVAAKAAATQQQRPRTWNMQTQLQNTMQQKSTNPQSANHSQQTPQLAHKKTPPTSSPRTINPPYNSSTSKSASQSATHKGPTNNNNTGNNRNNKAITPTSTTLSGSTSRSPSETNSTKLDGPVECNLCQRIFKNVPALNGHMRLHGGYFKKDTEPKKCDKKEHTGPPLQTASIGVRALIEEKIISKRSKQEVRALAAAAAAAAAASAAATSASPGTPATTVATSFAVPGPPVSFQRHVAEQQHLLHQELKSGAVDNIKLAKLPTTTQQMQATSRQFQQTNLSTSALSAADSKDATLIELLKRGTKVAVKRAASNPAASAAVGVQLTHNSNSIASRSAAVAPNFSHSSKRPTLAVTPVATATTSISTTSTHPSASTAGATSLALTISQAPSDSGDVFSLAYAADTSTAAYFDDVDTENDVYGVPDTTMLMQAVDSMHMLDDVVGDCHLPNAGAGDDDEMPDDGGDNNSEGQLSQLVNDLNSLNGYTMTAESTAGELGDNLTAGSHSLQHRRLNRYTPSRQLQAVLNSPLPESLAEFSALHSKDFVLYSGPTGCGDVGEGSPLSVTTGSGSPLASPLAYPTPPASHETVAHASPFMDDAHHYGNGNEAQSSAMYSSAGDWLKIERDSELTECERILRLKHELFEDSKSVLEENVMFFRTQDEDEDAVRVASGMLDSKAGIVSSSAGASMGDQYGGLDLLGTDNGSPDYLDVNEEQRQHASSPLSAAFFTGTMSTAEQVKEALQEVLPMDDVDIGAGEIDASNDAEQVKAIGTDDSVDLYYLTSMALQAQMLTADDPLLSSSPRDFGQASKATTTLSQQQTQQQTLQPVKTEPKVTTSNRCEFNSFVAPQQPAPPSVATRKPRLHPSSANNGRRLLDTDSLTHDQPGHSATILRKRTHSNAATVSSTKPKPHIAYRSKMRRHDSLIHFTPAPMLDPQRPGTGLLSSLQGLNSDSSYADVLDFDEDDDDVVDACLDFDFVGTSIDFRTKTHVNLGSDFQAALPDYDPYQLPPSDDRAQCLWQPVGAIESHCNSVQLQRFVELSRSSAVPLGCHSEEVALQTLMEAGGHMQRAILGLMQRPVQSMQARWQAREIEVFLRGLEVWGKDFQRIAAEIVTKATSDCVQLYYFWKKLSVDYKITHLGEAIAVDVVAPVKPATVAHVPEVRAHVCEMPDCSASFSSKAALHGHVRIHYINRNNNSNSQQNVYNHNNNNNNNAHPNNNHINQQQQPQQQQQQTQSHSTTSSINSLATTIYTHHQTYPANLNNSTAAPIAPIIISSGSDGGTTSLLSQQTGTWNGFPQLGAYPCKLCSKVFGKVRSRSAHMRTHRPAAEPAGPVHHHLATGSVAALPATAIASSIPQESATFNPNSAVASNASRPKAVVN